MGTLNDTAKLLGTLRAASAELPDVTEKKMFGCEAFFARGKIFALVWKTGRIAVKLTDRERYEALAKQKGAEPWSPGAMSVKSWLLMPPALEKPVALRPWLAEAHAMAATLAKAAPKKKTAAAKQNTSAKKKAPATR